MIITSYLFRQNIINVCVIAFVLLFIAIASQIDIFLKFSINQPSLVVFVIPIILNSIPLYISVIIPIAYFLGLVFTLGKLYSENEIVTMHSCGVSYLRLVSSLGLVMLVAFASVLYVNLFWLPESSYRSTLLIKERERRDLFDLLSPNTFIKLGDNPSKSIYISGKDETTGNFKDIFIIQLQHEEQPYLYTYAKGAEIKKVEALRYLALTDGYQISSARQKQSGYRIDFNELMIKLPEYKPLAKIEQKETMGNLELLTSDKHLDLEHFFWRISLSFIIPVLFFWGVIIGKVAPRKSRFSKAIPAFLILIASFAALILATQLAQKTIIPVYGTMLVPLFFLLTGLMYKLISK